MNAAKHAEQEMVAQAIKEAWRMQGEVPFPLYDREALQLAIAAIAALEKARGL